MAKQEQTSAPWVSREDQEWLGRWARQWATDPKNKFCDPAKPNEMDRQLLSLFDNIEACASDIDIRLDKLHETWKHSGFLTKTMYRYKMHYLFRGVGYGVASRAGQLKTDSAGQMLQNWNRVQNIYNGQDGSFRAAKAWVGPVTGLPSAEGVAVGEPRAAGAQERYRGGRYYTRGGAAYEGPLVDAFMEVRDFWRDRRARKAAALAAPTVPDRTDSGWDDGVVSDA